MKLSLQNIKHYFSILFISIFSNTLLIAKETGPDGVTKVGRGWCWGKGYWIGLGMYTKLATLLVLILILVALVILIVKMSKKK